MAEGEGGYRDIYVDTNKDEMVEGYGFTEVLVSGKQIISNSVNVSMLLPMRTQPDRPKGPKCKVDRPPARSQGPEGP